MNDLNLLKYDILKDIRHCFTTRNGGVSSGGQTSLNLSFSREKSRQNVCENYKICAQELKVDYNKMTGVPQKHTGNVAIIKEQHVGNCISSECIKELQDGYDAMITNIPGVTLCTLHADCVPVLLYDSINKVVAAIHSGWRGTALKISENTVNAMINNFNSNMNNIKAVIGPSIQIEKFETDYDVIYEFSKAFNISFDEMENKKLAYKSGNKYHISVSGFVYNTLINCGIKADNIFYDHTCTYENKDLFFSHRRDKGDTGAMSAMICLGDNIEL